MDEFIAWFRAQLDRDEQLLASTDGQTHGSPQASAYLERAPFDVEAKRAILAAFELADKQGQHPRGELLTYHATGLLTALKHLAVAYNHRPGYREEWKP